MRNAQTETIELNQRETSDGMLLRLWEDIERTLAVPPPVRSAPVQVHSSPLKPTREETPTRVRYALD
jgi:hypothetical protein